MNRARFGVCLGLILLAPLAAWARQSPIAPLADRIPADATAYIGWQGADAAAAGLPGTHLETILGESRIREVFSTFLPQLIDKLAKNQPDEKEAAQRALTVAGIAWHHPSAIFTHGFQTSGDNVLLRAAFVCRAGADADALKQALQSYVDDAAKNQSLPVRLFDAGDVTCLTIGFGNEDPVVVGADGAASAALAGSDKFQHAMSALDVKPVLAAYVDVAQLISEVRALPTIPDQARDTIDKALTASGLSGLQTISHACGFDGADWKSECFIAAPAPRTGFLAVDPAPLNADLLRQVPREASAVSAFRLDLAGLVTGIRDAVTKVNPDAGQKVDMVLGAAQMMTAVRLVDDVLQPLGTDWAVYSSEDVASAQFTGIIVVNKLRDPATAKTKLPTFQFALTNLASAGLRRQRMTLATGTLSAGDSTIYYFDTPFITPAWAIKGDYLYMGLYPQSVAAALRHPVDQSILDEPKFQAVMKRLGDKPAVALQYVDVPRSIGPMYAGLLAYERLGAGLAAMYGVSAPEPVLPAYDLLQKELAPAGSVSWIDDAGFHSRSIDPFPGASAVAMPTKLVTVGGAALGTSILLPSLARAREQANRIKCQSNERQIGQAILLYTNDNKNKYPSDLGTLITTEDIGPEAFVCPDSDTKVPAGFGQLPKDQQAAWVNDHSDYIYVGKDDTSDKVTGETVVLFEKPGAHNNDGMNILFGDGHVEFQVRSQAEQLIAPYNQQ